MAMKSGFWAVAQQKPDAPALVSADEQTLTFRQLEARANQLSNALRSLGLGPDDHVAILMNNEPAWIELFLATLQTGIYLTPINYHLTGPEVAYIVKDCGAKAFFANARYAEVASRAVEEIGFERSRCFAAYGDIPGFQDYETLLADQPTGRPADRTAGQLMLYTSGTTGNPKGVFRPRQQGDPDVVGSLSSMLGAIFGLKPGDEVHLVTGPLYHSAPGGFGTASLHMGHALVLMDKWDAERTLYLTDKYKVSVSHMVPTMFQRMLRLPEKVRNKYDLSSLKVIIHGAAPISIETKRAIIDWWGPVLYEYYGATEGGGALINSHDWLKKPGSLGKPFPGATLKILDDEGNELGPNEVGHVYMASMIGSFEYYNAPEKTRESFQGDLFTVGDIGYLDEEGWLYLCDRAKDMIISGGVNIYPAEIEKVLVEHPKVADVAVFGIPNDDWGEEVKAVVQPAVGVQGSDALTEELLNYCKDKLAKYKWPRSIDYMDELPRLDTGKLYKRYLRDQYWKGHDRKIGGA